MRSQHRLTVPILLTVALFLGLLAAWDLNGQEDPDVPRNVELTNRAWMAFQDHKYEDAIAAADRCITRFKKEADDLESELERKKAPPQPTGRVNASQKKAIFDQGLLNDVATCYWVKGRSAELLKRNNAAREAYSATTKYAYARTWDPKGWFWSPAEDAADRMQDLK
jgi:hypothetical protein